MICVVHSKQKDSCEGEEQLHIQEGAEGGRRECFVTGKPTLVQMSVDDEDNDDNDDDDDDDDDNNYDYDD
jgi:hypothetical protein